MKQRPHKMLVPLMLACALLVLPETPALATSAAASATVESAEASETPTELPTPPPTLSYRLEEDRSLVRFTGTWRFRNDGGSSGLSQRYSKVAYSSASMVFDGTGVAIISQLGPNHGRARVYLDGVATATVSMYAPAHLDQQRVFSVTGLPAGRHKLKIVVLGSKEASSTGTYVHLDALDIEGVPLSPGIMPGVRAHNGDKRLYRKGTWSTVKRAAAYRGAIVRTASKGAAMTMRFKGTDVMWFGSKDTGGGRSEVWLDGKRVALVSQYSTSTTTLDRRVVWAATGLKNTTHDVMIKSLGQRDVTDGGTRTDFDLFQVRGTVLTARRPTPFKYPWKTYIVIDKSSYKLHFVKNKMLVNTYPIAHGKHNCTPERIWRIDAKYHTSPGSVYGPRKMRMFKRVATRRGYRYVFTAYAIHGTNQEWVIGTQASHGCIRMYNRDVRELFPQVPLGTMVITRE
jgi:lipoprotein-anchoring transpeptidase ErfK/SrfK